MYIEGMEATRISDREALKDAMRIFRQARGDHSILANVRSETAKFIESLVHSMDNADAIMDEIDTELDEEDV